MPTQDTPVIHSPPKLPDQVRDRLRVKHYSMRTEHAYVDWIKRFMLFHSKRHPQAMGAPELTLFLTDLAAEAKCSLVKHNQSSSKLDLGCSARPHEGEGCFSLRNRRLNNDWR